MIIGNGVVLGIIFTQIHFVLEGMIIVVAAYIYNIFYDAKVY